MLDCLIDLFFDIADSFFQIGLDRLIARVARRK